MMRNPLVQTTLIHLHLQRRAHVNDLVIEQDAALETRASADRRIGDDLQLQQLDNWPQTTSCIVKRLSATLVAHIVLQQSTR